ncbi:MULTISPECIES: metallophosphoesterase [Streptomyces]|uniref:metallophosphoesterase n=1 Tax=Streptomyces TaxID=1883 RepID=UPI002B052A6D|nr:metallophosphoesterase [Streptomyces sp. JHD 1]
MWQHTVTGGAPGMAPAPAAVPAEAVAPARAAAPQGAAPPAEDDGYTPTQRDLPVLGPDAAQPTPTLVDVPSPAAPDGEPRGPLYVVGDVHGYLDELRAALLAAGLVDAEGHWAAGTARLWFLGDFTDRGPDGVGVIDLVMQLSAEAAAAGGYCKALLGNHELLIIGARRFGDTPVDSGAGTASFQAAWLLNGGQHGDMERLQDHHLQWMTRLDAMTLEDEHLLLHSDTTAYLDYGDTIGAVNDAITEALERRDPDETWELFRKFTKRFAFRDDDGPQVAGQMLATYGGRQVVHGHSPIPYLTGEAHTSDDAAAEGEGLKITGPHVYADRLAIAMDGGVTMAGKLLVSRLPLED